MILSSQFPLKIKSATTSLKLQKSTRPISLIDLQTDETRVTYGGLIYRITDSRDHSSELSGGSKVSKEIFLPSPSVPPLPTSRRNIPGKHFLPLEVLHAAHRESPTLRVGSSSTSSKLWTLSSDTRDSQFGLTRVHASMQGAGPKETDLRW